MTPDKKITKRKTSENQEKKTNDKPTEETKKTPKYGPLPTFPRQRIFTRGIIIFATLVVVYFSSNKKEYILASQKDTVAQRGQNVECSESYSKELSNFPDCVPEKCGRIVTDKLVTSTEADILLSIARNVISLAGSDGGASILDLHSGALSSGTQFIDVYTLEEAKKVLTAKDFAIYKIVRTKIQHAIAHNFGVDANKIFLTHPTFFSKMTSAEAKTVHDEYWHLHVDKDTYESFHYTSLVYLTDHNVDFTGGRLVFLGSSNSTVEPRKGRVLMFTSGAENPHLVEKVNSGIRYALTVSFTCDEKFRISDPELKFKS